MPTPPPAGAVTGTGTVNFLPLWDSTSDIVSSIVFQSGTGSTAKIGFNTTTPAATLDVKGTETVRGILTLPSTGTATSASAFNSQPITIASSVFNSGTGTAVAQNFRLLSEPTGNDTSTASGTLNLQFASGANSFVETGLKIASNGQITFATGQTFPGVPLLNGANTFAGNQTVNGNINATGQVISTIAQGTAPLQVASSTQVANLNASLLGGSPPSAFQQSGTYATLGSNDFGDIQNISANSTFPGLSANNFASGDGADGVTYGTANSFGIKGVNMSTTSNGLGAGVFGVEGSPSSSGAGRGSAGVWGDAGSHGLSGILATADNASAFLGINNSVGQPTLEIVNNASGGSIFEAMGTAGSCFISGFGNLNCSGSKSAVVPVDHGTRTVALYAVESPENWFEDVGSSRLSNGSALVTLESTFAQTVNTESEYHIFLTPKGDCEGFYVNNETSTGFEVHELRGGHSNVAFDYRIMARRKGYENIRLADMTKSMPKPPGR
jgi:hypothetical protein